MANPELSEEQRRAIFEELKSKFDGKVSFTPKTKTIGKKDSQWQSRNKNKQK